MNSNVSKRRKIVNFETILLFQHIFVVRFETKIIQI